MNDIYTKDRFFVRMTVTAVVVVLDATTLSIMTLSITIFSITIKSNTQHNNDLTVISFHLHTMC